MTDKERMEMLRQLELGEQLMAQAYKHLQAAVKLLLKTDDPVAKAKAVRLARDILRPKH